MSRLAMGPTITLPEALLPWARRQLALTMVDIDPQANRGPALKLLGPDAVDSSPADIALNGRARAFIQAADPAERARMRSVLEAQVAAMDPAELFRLAQLAEADGDSGRALTHARQAWDGDKDNPVYLAWLIRGLVKMNQRDEARRLLALLTAKEGDSERCRELRTLLEKP
jgi:thioredoxin-like negative regulator of GroEL